MTKSNWGLKNGKLKRSRGGLPQFIGGKSAGDIYTETEVRDVLQIVGNHAINNLHFFVAGSKFGQ